MAAHARRSAARRAPARRASSHRVPSVAEAEGGGFLLLIAGAGFVLYKLGVFDLLTSGALNPSSDSNLAYKGANAAGSAVTGDPDFTVGGWLYDVTHPAAFDPTFATGSTAKAAPVATDAAGTPIDGSVFVGAP